jgi:hypothetical protein
MKLGKLYKNLFPAYQIPIDRVKEFQKIKKHYIQQLFLGSIYAMPIIVKEYNCTLKLLRLTENKTLPNKKYLFEKAFKITKEKLLQMETSKYWENYKS